MRQLFLAAVMIAGLQQRDPAHVIVTPLLHSSIQLEYAGQVVQVDPWSLADLSKAKPADVILITDDPAHHLDVKAVRRLRKPGAPVLLPPAAHSRFPEGIAIANGEKKTAAGITVEAVAAYDIKPGEPSHPKGEANGYLVTLGGARIYVAGVTECVPEVRALRDIDIAFVPMNIPLERMTPAAAAECVNALKPKVVYVYHYDQDYTSRLTGSQGAAPRGDTTAIDASLRAFRAALDPGIEFRQHDWYSRP